MKDQKDVRHITLRLDPATHIKAKLLLVKNKTNFQKFLTKKIEELLALDEMGVGVVNNSEDEDLGKAY